MYYAACCCDRPPTCGCGGLTYATVSFSFSQTGGIGPVVTEQCDRICRRDSGETFHDIRTRYAEAKIYMACDTSTTSATDYSTQSPQMDGFQTYDAENLVILETASEVDFSTWTIPFVGNCCDAPFNNDCDPSNFGLGGRYVELFSETETLLPFDPLDIAFPQLLQASASTRVVSGSGVFIPNNIGGIEIDPDLFYRITTCEVLWRLPLLVQTYDQRADGTIETSESTQLSGDFGGPSTARITRVSEVGPDCDAHNPGKEVVTWVGDENATSPELVPSDSRIYWDNNTDCPAESQQLSCCGPDQTVESPAGTTTRSNIFGSQYDGGIFSLEFSDDPPPTL